MCAQIPLVNDVRKCACAHRTQNRVPGLTPLGVPGLTPLGVPGLTPLGVPGLTLLGVPDLTPLGVPGLTQLGIPGITPRAEVIKNETESRNNRTKSLFFDRSINS
ncbi:hypothetical protein AVEN_182011-1 [Araneus ventricosus]|uniref:Uncharacterized protein n=1 Tax=Araneus ventricosus TaxID=182803 RepID=A0A4Y2RUE0_ARAVE|nr:hypothetical protein AVEN_182011-1 [Araneus ventricosus]